MTNHTIKPYVVGGIGIGGKPKSVREQYKNSFSEKAICFGLAATFFLGGTFAFKKVSEIRHNRDVAEVLENCDYREVMAKKDSSYLRWAREITKINSDLSRNVGYLRLSDIIAGENNNKEVVSGEKYKVPRCDCKNN